MAESHAGTNAKYRRRGQVASRRQFRDRRFRAGSGPGRSRTARGGGGFALIVFEIAHCRHCRRLRANPDGARTGRAACRAPLRPSREAHQNRAAIDLGTFVMDVAGFDKLLQIVGHVRAQIVAARAQFARRQFLIADIEQSSACTLLISRSSRRSSSSLITSSS